MTSASLPPARGPLSSAVIEGLRGADTLADTDRLRMLVAGCADPLGDDDLHLALYLIYELSYRGLVDVDDAMEWDPAVVACRLALERPFEAALRIAVPPIPVAADDVPTGLRTLAREGPGTTSRFLEREADLETYQEFVIHRSAYHLKEADPHSFAIPRLTGAPKVSLVEIQADEYGGGDASWMHAALFAQTMRGVGLDDSYGAYLARIPGSTLATVNLMSLFGLHRRLRGALVGHLAMFELTSTLPNRRYGNGLRRLGFDEATTRFFDEHVEADAVHEAIAANDLAGGLAAAEPHLASQIMFGARALLALDDRSGEGMLASWRAGRSSLLPPDREPADVGMHAARGAGRVA